MLTAAQIYHDVLCTLDRNPLAGVCSPSLMGSNGVCPLTIMATVPDICRHMSNVIARAEHEVYLATNFWMYSEPSRLITNALRELSRKAVEKNRRVVVKIIYDRGSVKQVSASTVKKISPLTPAGYQQSPSRVSSRVFRSQWQSQNPAPR
jgi:phosphatidylserine/phosphatidylglycerophosphate/cardiolipin synthase-like enzyme